MFYVYEHWRPDLDRPFYVGKGRGKRAHKMGQRTTHHNRIVAKVSRLGMTIDVRFARTGLTESKAFEIERERIAYWRSQGIELTNKTDGGEGASGIKLSAGAKEKLRRHAIGRQVSDATRAKMRAARIGKNLTDETKARLSRSLINTYRCPELRKKIGAIHRGKTYSTETREKIRRARIIQGNPRQTAEGRKLAAEKNRGQKRSDATKALLRQRWVERKLRAANGVP